MNVKQLICARKKDIARRGYKPGKARVTFGGYDDVGDRKFHIVIPASPDHLMLVTGSCDVNENHIHDSHSVIFNPDDV